MTLLLSFRPFCVAVLVACVVATGAGGARAESGGLRVLVTDLKSNGVDPATTRTLQAVLVDELAHVHGLDVIAGADLKNLAALEADRQDAGCDADAACLAEIADALGADMAVFGDVGALQTQSIVTLSLVNTKALGAPTRVKVTLPTLDAANDALLFALPELLAGMLSGDDRALLLQRVEERRARHDSVALNTTAGPPLYIVNPRVVELPLTLEATVSSAIAQTATQEGMAVFTKDDARVVLERTADVTALGGDSDGAALAALGKKVGVRHVLACVVSAVDGDTVVAVRLIDVQEAAAVARRQVKTSDFRGSLLDAVQAATRLVLQPVFAAERGTLALTVSEQGANIFVDDSLVATTPLAAPLVLPGGHHLIAVEKEGFVRNAQTVRVTAGQALARTVALVPSVEFLSAYRSRNGVLRTLAWSSTAAAALTGAAAGVAWGGQLLALQDLDAVNAKWDATLIDTPTGRKYPDAATAEQANTERGAATATAQQWGWGVNIAGPAFLVTAALAVTFFIVGDDPSRYDAPPAAPAAP